MTYTWVGLFIASVVAANSLVAVLGPWSIPVVSFAFIGLDMACRDALHEKWHQNGLHWKMPLIVGTGTAISSLPWVSSVQIAVGSGTSFFVSGMVDYLVYSLMFRRSYAVKANVSNACSSILDSVMFPWIAFGLFSIPLSATQTATKMAGGAMWTFILIKARHANNNHSQN